MFLCFHFDATGSSPDPDPTLAQTVPNVTENQLNASLGLSNSGSLDNSGSAPATARVNGTYANFTTYNHTRSSTVVSPENGKIMILTARSTNQEYILQLGQASQANRQQLGTMETTKLRWQ